MTLRPPRAHSTPLSLDGNTIETALYAAAALDTPPSSLHSRILADVERKRHLDTLEVPFPKPRSTLPKVMVSVAIAAAASIGLFFGQFVASKARPEPAKISSVNPAVSTLPSSTAAATLVAATRVLQPKRADPCTGASRASGSFPLVDDFEDGDDLVLRREQRAGFWRWSRDTDKPGTAPALIPMERPFPTRTNQYALHVKGTTLRDWGASIEMKFEPPCYDASVYRGLTFSARGPGRIYVSPREVGVVPLEFGGTCEHDCYNGHTMKIDLGKSFQTYEVRWTEVTQRGYNRPPFDPKRLHDITFLIHAEDTPYDVWLDDVRFSKH